MDEHGWYDDPVPDNFDPVAEVPADDDPPHHPDDDDLPRQPDDDDLPRHPDDDTAAPVEDRPAAYHPDGDGGADPGLAPAGDAADPNEMGPVGADPDAPAEADADPVSPFPPILDVGPLPEPVDGFPWTDAAVLGTPGPQGDSLGPDGDGTEPVDPAGLAEHAATQLPPGADPWAALAAHEDPATSALARWWGRDDS